MSLGLPGHLAPHSESRAFARASHVIALVCITAAFVMVLLLQFSHPDVMLWPTSIALIPMVVALVLLERYRSLFFTITYLLVGAASLYWFELIGSLQFPGTAVTAAFVFSMPKMALIFVGGAGIGLARIAGWCALGFVVGEAVTIAAAVQTGAQIVPDVRTIAVLVIAVAMLGVISLSKRRVADAQPSLHRAARDEHLSDMRHRVELRAAAMMHDTILNHLAAVSTSPDGVIRAELRDRIERDLEVLVGQEWLVDGDEPESGGNQSDWEENRLFRAVEEARELGLTVVLSGDRAAVARLDPARQVAVSLAVKQCLVNVLTHAGTDQAEVVIYGSGSEVSVMVIDAGKGFSERETSVDRLGLRQSVRRRIEAVGGSVQVWSTPGSGTSVLMRLPAPRDGDDGVASP